MSKKRKGFTLIELLVVIAHHRHFGRSLAPGRAGGPRSGPAHPVPQQPQATRTGRAQLPRHQQAIDAGDDVHVGHTLLRVSVIMHVWVCHRLAPPDTVKIFVRQSFGTTCINWHFWGERLLPMIGATTVYNRICFNQPMLPPCCEHSPVPVPCIVCCPIVPPYTYKNITCPTQDPCSATRPGAAVIPTFVCPSAPRTANPFVEISQAACPQPVKWTVPVLAGASDYQPAGGYPTHSCLGIGAAYRILNGGVEEKSGAAALNGVEMNVSFDRITDGTSTTILFTELAGRPDLWIRGVKKRVPCDMPPDPEGGA